MKKTNIKGWQFVSSLAICLAGQSFVMQPSHAIIKSFVGVQNLKLLSPNEAQKITFSNASSFVEINLAITDEMLIQIAKKTGVSKMAKDKETKAWKAVDSKGKAVGYFFVDKVYGKHELITYSVGINLDGTVKHIEILDYRETYGWQIDNKNWRGQFVGKNSQSTLTLGKDIKNISGATLSCRHIADGVKRMLVLYEFFVGNKA